MLNDLTSAIQTAFYFGAKDSIRHNN